jgi:hypothetical protein
MRQCLNSAGVDVTTACMNYLLGTSSPLIRHLYMIGYPEDPNAILMTDHEAPVIYSPWGTFQPAVVKNGSIATKVGLDVQKTTVTWTPGNLTAGNSLATANPLQLARAHYYDNWQVRIWKCFMPTPGGILGACEWFGGRIGSCTIGRTGLEFSVSSFLDVVTQKVPANVIESTSTLAGYTAATVPAGDSNVPIFNVFTGSSTTVIYGDTISPTANRIYGTGSLVGGYMVFLSNPSGTPATLAGIWSAIGNNLEFTDGNSNNHNQFNIYSALPWAPTPGVDRFYVSSAAPINFADSQYFGFNFVPQPSTAA